LDDAELRALLAAQSRLIAELSERLAPARKTVPLGELYARYEVARKARPAWHSVKAMLWPFVDRYRERDAAGLVVQDWMAYREARTAQAQPENGVIAYSPLSPSSRNLTLAYVKSMLRSAVAGGLLDVEPKLCIAPTEKQKDHRETAPNEEEVQRLLAVCTKPRERVIVLCACDSGMRRNEIRQLAHRGGVRDPRPRLARANPRLCAEPPPRPRSGPRGVRVGHRADQTLVPPAVPSGPVAAHLMSLGDTAANRRGRTRRRGGSRLP
jgi:hypothetical protein